MVRPRRILSICILLGLLFWAVDGYLDYRYSYGGRRTVSGLPFTDIPLHDVCVRTFVLVLFVVLGFYLYGVFTKQEALAQELRVRTHDLGERCKELQCFQDMARLVEEPDISLSGILQGTVDLIPAGWQHAGSACARITVDGDAFTTANFRETSWRMSSPISVSGETVGSADVFYLEEFPHETEGPFLAEERHLLDLIAERTGRIVERFHVTEALRNSESRFRRAVEQAPFPIIVFTEDGEVLSLSSAWTEITGYGIEDMPTVRRWTELAFGPHADDVREDIESLFGRTGRVDQGEFEIRCSDGETRVWAFSSSPVGVLPDGRRAVISMATDVTARRRAETEREKIEAQMLQAQKMEAIGRLAGGVAHDFNNILTGVIGYLDFALRQLPADHEVVPDLEEVRSLSTRAVGLTQQLLAFSRRQTLEPHVLCPNRMIGDLSRMLKRLLGENIDLEFYPASDLGNVRVDPGQIEQVLMNLVVNARDAMPDGGRLTIETQNVTLDETYAANHPEVLPGDYIMIAVSDTGHGMDEVTRSRIFEPFFTTKAIGKGTGLGLATAYGIVRQHGGHIWLYTELNAGACFKVYLPRVTMEVEEASAAPTGPVAGRGETVLVVEDEVSVLRTAHRSLSIYGYRVLTASSGEAARRICADNGGSIDLVVTDVVLPNENGRALFESLHASHTHLKVLYMSGYTADAIVHHGVLDPGMAFLSKPFTPAGIARKVREVLDA